jgi:hypothetical protein
MKHIAREQCGTKSLLFNHQTRAHACSALASSSRAVAASRGTGALALQRGGVHVMRNLRARLPNPRQTNGRRLVALTQRSNRQRKGRSAWRGRITLSTLPWSTSAAKASRLHRRSSLEDGARQKGIVSAADAMAESVSAAYKSRILQYLPFPACRKRT